MVLYWIIEAEYSPAGHLVQPCSECLAQCLMNPPAYFMVDVAIVLRGPRIWRRSVILTVTLRWPCSSWMNNYLIVSFHCAYSVQQHHATVMVLTQLSTVVPRSVSYITVSRTFFTKLLISEFSLWCYVFHTFRRSSPFISATLLNTVFELVWVPFQDMFTYLSTFMSITKLIKTNLARKMNTLAFTPILNDRHHKDLTGDFWF